MIWRVAFFIVTCSTTYLSFRVGLLPLFPVLQPVVVVSTILVAAILVRLNRGMPSLEWKSVDPRDRAELTTRIVEMARHYVTALAIVSVTLIGALILLGIGPDYAKSLTPRTQEIVAAVCGASAGMSITHMAFIVWRDFDLVVLQKRLIDRLAAKEIQDEEVRSASERGSAIKSNLRSLPQPSPRAFAD